MHWQRLTANRPLLWMSGKYRHVIHSAYYHCQSLCRNSGNSVVDIILARLWGCAGDESDDEEIDGTDEMNGEDAVEAISSDDDDDDDADDDIQPGGQRQESPMIE